MILMFGQRQRQWGHNLANLGLMFNYNNYDYKDNIQTDY